MGNEFNIDDYDCEPTKSYFDEMRELYGIPSEPYKFIDESREKPKEEKYYIYDDKKYKNYQNYQEIKEERKIMDPKIPIVYVGKDDVDISLYNENTKEHFGILFAKMVECGNDFVIGARSSDYENKNFCFEIEKDKSNYIYECLRRFVRNVRINIEFVHLMRDIWETTKYKIDESIDWEKYVEEERAKIGSRLPRDRIFDLQDENKNSIRLLSENELFENSDELMMKFDEDKITINYEKGEATNHNIMLRRPGGYTRKTVIEEAFNLVDELKLVPKLELEENIDEKSL